MNGDRLDGRILEQLFEVIESRRGADAATSYTARLLSKGRNKIAKKTGEEAVEVVVAALAEGRQELAAESADLLYHLLVLWASAGVKPGDVWTELTKRQGVSGLAEKAARRSDGRGKGTNIDL
jgi:phosphoribosyl-ATP pyrophosphohydrolase